MQVYDDFLKPEIAQEAYEFVLKSYYQIGWEDSLVPEQRTYGASIPGFVKKLTDWAR